MDRDSGFQWRRLTNQGIDVDGAGTWWSGRVRSVLPRSDGRVIVGTETGGVWVTDEDGAVALPLSVGWGQPSVASLAFGPDGESQVFAGGGGLHVTDQAGFLPLLDWHEISSINGQLPGGIGALAVLDQPRRIVVAGPTGVVWADIPAAAGPGGWADTYMWNPATGSALSPFSMAIGSRNRALHGKATGTQDTTVVVGGSYGGIWVGDWRGGTLNFTPATIRSGQPADMRSTYVAACEQVPSRLYACCCGPDHTTLAAVYFSDDGGDTWTICPYDLEQLAGLVDFLGDMGTQHSCLGVHRSRPDTLAIGWLGGPAYSTDAGRTWKLPTGGIHADKHAIAFAPDGGDRVYVGCDGGVFSTDNLGDGYRSAWNRLLPTLQCYSSDGARQSWGGAGATVTIPGLVATGTQDNGNVFVMDSGDAPPFRPLTGADGGFCVALATQPVVLTVLSLQSSPQPIVAHIWDPQQQSFIATYEPKIITSGPGQTAGESLHDPLCVEAVTRPRTNPDHPSTYAVATVGKNLYALIHDPHAGLGGTGWGGQVGWHYLGSGPEDLWAAGSCFGELVYVGTASRRLFSIDQQGSVFEFGFTPAGRTPGVIHRIIQLPDLSAFAINRTAKGSVIYYPAGGFAWHTLFEPGSTVWALEVCDRPEGTVLVAATETQVYSSYDGGLTWFTATDRLPANPMCADLRYAPDTRRIHLSTYGWSIWTADVPTNPPPRPALPHLSGLAAGLAQHLQSAQQAAAGGDQAGAAAAAEQGFADFVDLAATDPDGASAQTADLLGQLAGYLPDDRAAEVDTAAAAIYQRLADTDPAYRLALALSTLQAASRRQKAATAFDAQARALMTRALDLLTGLEPDASDAGRQQIAQHRSTAAASDLDYGTRLFSAGDHASTFQLFDEALAVLRDLIAQPGGLATYGPTFVSWVHWPIALTLEQDGQSAKAAGLCDEAVRYARQLGDRAMLAGALLDAGIAYWGVPDHQATFRSFDETLTILRELIGQPRGLATYGPTFVTWVHWPIALMLEEDGQHAKAAGICDEAVGYARQLGDRAVLAGALLDAGIAHWGVPDHPGTFYSFDDTLTILRELIGQPGGLATHGPTFVSWVHWPIALMLEEDGQHAKAAGICDEAVGYARQLGDRAVLAGALLDAGIAHWGVPDHAGTFRSFDETLTILRQLMTQPDGRRTYGPTFISWARWPIGEMLEEDGQHDAAAALAAEAAALGRL